MSSMRYKIKKNAKAVLEKNWLKAIVIILIIFFLSVAISSLETAYRKALNFPEFTTSFDSMSAMQSFLSRFAGTTLLLSAVFAVFSFIMTTPLKLGQTEWYWRLTDKKPQGVEGVFAWFGSLRLFAKSLWLRINIYLRMLPWFLLIIAVPYAALFISGILLSSKVQIVLTFALILMVVSELMLAGGLFLFLYIASRYFLASYLLVEDNTRKVTSCVRDSIRYTRGQRGEIFTFWLSFAGWFMLCALALPALYVVPYFNASSVIYAKFIIYSERMKERNESEKTEEIQPVQQDK